MNWIKLLLAQRLITVAGLCSVSFALSTRLAAQTAPAAQQVADGERIEWFQRDKFGMFIHWGPYSYLAGEWNGQSIPVGTEAEWIMQRFNIPVAQYREMAHHLISTPMPGWLSPKLPG